MRREARPALLWGLMMALAASGCGGGGEATGPVDTTPSASGPLLGVATAPASGAIPQQTYAPRAQDFSTTHPQMPGVQISFNTITLVLQPTVTVGEANALLEAQGATIVGGFPGKAGTTSGILVLRLATTSHDQLLVRLAALRQDARVRHVVQDAMLAPTVVTKASFEAGPPAAWTWFLAPGGDNWGMEMIRAPQMWNLNAAIAKAGGAGVATLVIDGGFKFVHPDLTYLNQPTNEDEHGTHVAGIIGATFDNNLGVDGVNPFARMIVRNGLGPDATWAELLVSIVGPLLRANTSPAIRVINTSLAFSWGKLGIEPSTNPQVQLLVETSGAVLHEGLKSLQAEGIALPVWVTAAGNDGVFFDNQVALWSSPMTNAAQEHGARNIIVVESVNLGGNVVAGETTRSFFSNIGGHLSAPGSQIMSTSITPAYETMNGTSMASPHVAGLVGFLYALDPGLPSPTLDANPALDLLLANAVPAGGGARPRIDAFASAMDVDRVLGGNVVLRKLVDVDDGTPDGNHRANADGTDFITDTHGDGKVTMADFRRWRDWALQIHEPQAQFLDGAVNHEKKDINGDGAVDLGAPEDVYTRGDFNGDGELTIDTTTRFVPGALSRRVTDLEMLQELFTDPDYAKSELPDLIRSGDMHIDATTCLAIGGTVTVRSTIQLPGNTALVRPARNHVNASPLQIYTIPVSATGTQYRMRVEARDASGSVVQSAQVDTLLLMGQDIRFKPTCAPPFTVVVTPTSIVLQPGQTQQFTATVTGNSNTAVTWSATGGTITQTGLFTAGLTLGTYQVTATSNADPSKKGSAAVTVRLQTATIEVDSTEGQLHVSAQSNIGLTCDTTRAAPKNLRSDSDSAGCSASSTGDLASSATSLARRTLRIEPVAGGTVSSIQLSVAGEGTGQIGSQGVAEGSGSSRQSVCFKISVASSGFTATGTLSALPHNKLNGGNGSAEVLLWKMNAARRPESVVFQASVGDVVFGGPFPNSAIVSRTGTLAPALYCLGATATGYASGDRLVPSEEAKGSAELTLTFSP